MKKKKPTTNYQVQRRSNICNKRTLQTFCFILENDIRQFYGMKRVLLTPCDVTGRVPQRQPSARTRSLGRFVLRSSARFSPGPLGSGSGRGGRDLDRCFRAAGWIGPGRLPPSVPEPVDGIRCRAPAHCRTHAHTHTHTRWGKPINQLWV